MKLSKRVEQVEKEMTELLKESGAKSFVIGISGGIDSAVSAAMCHSVSPKSTGLWIPIESSDSDHKDAVMITKNVGMQLKDIEVNKAFLNYKENVPTSLAMPSNIVTGNLKARLRAVALRTYANSYNFLIAGTGNLTEETLGYFTKGGDSEVDFQPLYYFTKSEVKQIAKLKGIPDSVIKKAPSAGLWEGQTDEDELGLTYDVMDCFSLAVHEMGGISISEAVYEHTMYIAKKLGLEITKEQYKKMEKMYLTSEHKRTMKLLGKRN